MGQRAIETRLSEAFGAMRPAWITTGNRMTPHLALEYIVLRCADLERSRAFYEALGFKPVSEQHGTGARHYVCDLGGVVVELYPTATPQTSNLRLGLRVAALGAVVDALTTIGASIVRVDAAGTSALVRDPDGHEIALQTTSPRPVM